MQITHSEFKSYRAVCAEIADIKSQLDARYAGDTVQSGEQAPLQRSQRSHRGLCSGR